MDYSLALGAQKHLKAQVLTAFCKTPQVYSPAGGRKSPQNPLRKHTHKKQNKKQISKKQPTEKNPSTWDRVKRALVTEVFGQMPLIFAWALRRLSLKAKLNLN